MAAWSRLWRARKSIVSTIRGLAQYAVRVVIGMTRAVGRSAQTSRSWCSIKPISLSPLVAAVAIAAVGRATVLGPPLAPRRMRCATRSRGDTETGPTVSSRVVRGLSHGPDRDRRHDPDPARDEISVLAGPDGRAHVLRVPAPAARRSRVADFVRELPAAPRFAPALPVAPASPSVAQRFAGLCGVRRVARRRVHRGRGERATRTLAAVPDGLAAFRSRAAPRADQYAARHRIRRGRAARQLLRLAIVAQGAHAASPRAADARARQAALRTRQARLAASRSPGAASYAAHSPAAAGCRCSGATLTAAAADGAAPGPVGQSDHRAPRSSGRDRGAHIAASARP